MSNVLNFENFLNENYLPLEEAEEKKISGDIVISSAPSMEEFSLKDGVPYMIVTDNSVEFVKKTPVDTVMLSLGGVNSRKQGVYFQQIKKPNPPVEKKFFSPEKVLGEALDILLQIYTLYYKEDIQDLDEQDLTDILKSLSEVDKMVASKRQNNPTFKNLIMGLKSSDSLETKMGEKSKIIDEKVKEKIIKTVQSVF